ncbi:caspase family protein [Streptomyces sp. R44]|uniref:Caspase family protein n=1 Tax=Streptomyces sp. R44 TaxID=3238633 RepID=A0AB39T223_9ACTN
MSEAEGRRFLITIGVGTYKDEEIADLPGVPHDVRRVRELLLPMGYELALEELAFEPTSRDVAEAVEEWAHDANLGPGDTVVVYFAGHGVKAPDRHYLLCSTTRRGRFSTALATEDLSRPLVLSPVGHLLVILDTCYAGAGSGDISVLASELTPVQRGPAGRWTLASARGKEQARENAFVDALAEVLEQPRAGGHQEYLGVREVTERVNQYFADRGLTQHANHSTVDSSGKAPFFHNKAHIPGLPTDGLDVGTLTRLRRESRGHFEARGRGLEHLGERGDHFTGRKAALDALTGWLTADRHDHKARAVTGDPGSGKSAVLGRLLRITEHQMVVPLHARRAVLEELVADLTAALRLPRPDRDELLDSLGQRTEPVVVLVDALDEAGTAGDSDESMRIARELLRPLSSLPTVRLIVGTRRPQLPSLGRAVEVVDLDTELFTSPDDVAAYATRLLLAEGDPAVPSPYKNRPDEARTVAEGIAARAGRSFLVARMTARTLIEGQIAVDTSVPGWTESLPSDADQAFAGYLARFGPDRPRVERLLRPLAYAQGAGLPWSTLWAPLAEALSGLPCPQDDLRWLHEHAGSYVVETEGPDGTSAYRLFHETMAEYLRRPGPDRDAHRTMTQALLERVPTDPRTGVRDWAAAHAYVRDHLASHAAGGGCLDRLLGDSEYLVHASPPELLRALDAVTTPEGRQRRSVYRASADVHRYFDVPGRRDVLAVDAARYGLRELAAELARDRPWRPRWATGGLVHPALHSVLDADGPVTHVACVAIEGRPHVLAVSRTTLHVWDLATSRPLMRLPADGRYLGPAPTVRAMTTTEVDGQPWALVLFGDEIHIWNLVAETHRRVPVDTPWGIRHIVCTAVGGRPHAVLVDGPDLRVWDLIDDAWRTVPSGHSVAYAVACADIDGRPHAVTTGDSDRLLHVVDLIDGQARPPLTVQGRIPRQVIPTILEDRPHLVGHDDFDEVRVWDLTTGTLRATHPRPPRAFNDLTCVDIDGRPHAVAVSDDGLVRVWALDGSRRRPPLSGHTDMVMAVAAVVDGRPYAVTGGLDGLVRVWDLTEDSDYATLPGHAAQVRSVLPVALEGRPHIVTVDAGATLEIRDLARGSVRSRLKVRADWTSAVAAVHPGVSGPPLALSSDGKTVRLWDLAAGRSFATLLKGKGTHWSEGGVAEVLIEGRPHVLLDYHTGTEVWDLTNRSMRGALPTEADPIRSLTCAEFSGRPYALTGHTSGVTRVWDLVAYTLVAQLDPRDESWINAVVCATIEGTPHAITGSDSGKLRVWNLATRALRHELPAHFRSVNALACVEIADRPHLLSGGADSTLLITDLVLGQPIEAITMPLPIDALAAHGDDIVMGLRNEVVVLTPSAPRR